LQLTLFDQLELHLQFSTCHVLLKSKGLVVMTPAFGFSAGDFISAVGLITKVCKALKDTGGAADEYQSLLTELNLLKTVFEHLAASSSSSSGTNSYGAYIETHTLFTLAKLSEFLQTIFKFDPRLGKSAPTGWRHGFARKSQWAVVYAKEIEKFRRTIGTQLQSMNLLLGLNER
jgi:hypothetical protein